MHFKGLIETYGHETKSESTLIPSFFLVRKPGCDVEWTFKIHQFVEKISENKITTQKFSNVKKELLARNLVDSVQVSTHIPSQTVTNTLGRLHSITDHV